MDLISQDISLVEEEDDGGVEEPGRMDGGVEQSQTLLHAVLRKRKSQIFPWTWQNSVFSLYIDNRDIKALHQKYCRYNIHSKTEDMDLNDFGLLMMKWVDAVLS